MAGAHSERTGDTAVINRSINGSEPREVVQWTTMQYVLVVLLPPGTMLRPALWVYSIYRHGFTSVQLEISVACAHCFQGKSSSDRLKGWKLAGSCLPPLFVSESMHFGTMAPSNNLRLDSEGIQDVV